jgi:TolB-like protein/Flp pilus assembly protein TadD
VFLSYASQDAEAARKICEALRQAGIEVWFDQSELRGGDTWDQSIRRQIKTCALFVPVISRNTHERDEGYFRLEWKLAIDRSHLITSNRAFLLPVVIDATPDDDEQVPEKFREVQWTRLPGGEAPTEFVERVRRLLSPEPAGGASTSRITAAPTAQPLPRRVSRREGRGPTLIAVALALILVSLAIDRIWTAKRSADSPGTAAHLPAELAASATTVFNPPPHSIAVLPFENLSGDKEQDYFSDGLSEELLNSLTRINELQVAARTSSFYFKGMHTDLATIAHKLNVAAVLEGSVRRGGHTIRVTAELTNALTGFHVWSQTYDRELSDVLQLQTDIANAVTSALKIALLGNVAQKIEVGGTHNPSAFDAYLHAAKAYRGNLDEKGMQQALAGYSEAIHLDPEFAMAYADRSFVLDGLGRNYVAAAKRHDYYEKGQADARKAITLVPDLAVGHLALANILNTTLDFAGASTEYARTLALAPGDAKVLNRYGQFEVLMGHSDVGLEALRRSVTLDPLSSSNYFVLGETLVFARRPNEALTALNEVKSLDPDDVAVYGWLGYAYLAMPDYEHAKEACERTIEANRFHCLTMAYDGLGRHADAQVMLTRLLAMSAGNDPVFIAMIYAQRGDVASAVDYLDRAVRERDPYLEYVKTNVFLDPLRKEPRFQAIERSLKFPD